VWGVVQEQADALKSAQSALWHAVNSGVLVNATDVNVSNESIRATAACLLRNGASVNGKDSKRKSLLDRVQEWDNDPQLIHMLKQAGARK